MGDYAKAKEHMSAAVEALKELDLNDAELHAETTAFFNERLKVFEQAANGEIVAFPFEENTLAPKEENIEAR